MEKEETPEYVEWKIPGETAQGNGNSEFLRVYKKKDLIWRGNDHWYGGGVNEFSKEEALEDFGDWWKYNASSFGDEVKGELEILLGGEE